MCVRHPWGNPDTSLEFWNCQLGEINLYTIYTLVLWQAVGLDPPGRPVEMEEDRFESLQLLHRRSLSVQVAIPIRVHFVITASYDKLEGNSYLYFLPEFEYCNLFHQNSCIWTNSVNSETKIYRHGTDIQRILSNVFILQDYRFASVVTKKGLDHDEHLRSSREIETNLPCSGYFTLLSKNFLGTIHTFHQHQTQ